MAPWPDEGCGEGEGQPERGFSIRLAASMQQAAETRLGLSTLHALFHCAVAARAE